MARILVIDDDPSLARALRLGLRASGHDVLVAPTGEEGIIHALTDEIDVIVLDLGLPDIDGLQVCRRIREWSAVPIIVLSANFAEDRKVQALNEGADDYVTKPFGMAELEARIRTALRHARPEGETGDETDEAPVIEVGALVLDRGRREVRVSGEVIKLTSKEFDVLAYLAQNVGRVCTHQMILSTVWGNSYAKESQYLHVYINRLRHKVLEASKLDLESVPGVGYLLREIAE
jgi:two-component system KDP operon response regulator KdpE